MNNSRCFLRLESPRFIGGEDVKKHWYLGSRRTAVPRSQRYSASQRLSVMFEGIPGFRDSGRGRKDLTSFELKTHCSRTRVCGQKTASGIFNTGYGLSWFLGSLAMGILYDRSGLWAGCIFSCTPTRCYSSLIPGSKAIASRGRSTK